MAAFSAQNEADLTLPECAVVEVIGKSLTGWWKVRSALNFAGIIQNYAGTTCTANLYICTIVYKQLMASHVCITDYSHGGSAGLVPASLLALTDANSLEADEISEEEKLALSIVSNLLL